MMRRDPVKLPGRMLMLVALLLLSVGPGTAAESVADEGADAPPQYRGLGYLAGFFVTNIDTTVSVFSRDVPVGVRIDLTNDLGFGESESVPRATLGWRFGERRRHLLLGGWYRLDRGANKTLEATLPLPPGEKTPIGVNLSSAFVIDLAKVQYTWIFHQDDKVTLGLGAGLFLGGFRFRVDDSIDPDVRFDKTWSAPLPVAGLRLGYRITPRSQVVATADWFFIRYDDSSGVLGDFLVFYNHRTFKHVGFAGGLNLWTQKVDFVDDDLVLDVDQGFIGYLAGVTFHF